MVKTETREDLKGLTVIDNSNPVHVQLENRRVGFVYKVKRMFGQVSHQLQRRQIREEHLARGQIGTGRQSYRRQV